MSRSTTDFSALRLGLRCIAVIFLAAAPVAVLHAQVLAFPGAEGFGRYASGGRGGRVCEVTTLADSGPGSFRDAVLDRGSRTVVFRVAGTIALRSPIIIRNGNLTIAGQSAPGDGICIRNYDVRVEASNVIIRYVRFRRGDSSGSADDAFSGGGKGAMIPGPVIIDHCSASWGIDETSSFYDVGDFTMQWCFVTESLHRSVHPKGDHGYGGIWGGRRASFHHNLLAHHASRSPRFNGGRTSGMPDSEGVDFRNNVVYNWGFNGAYGGERGRQNMIANYFRAGPATRKQVRDRIVEPWDSLGQWYVAQNVVYGSPAVSADNWNGGVQGKFAAAQKRTRRTVPFPVAQVTTQTADDALSAVLAHGGANLPRRDALDERIVREVREGTATYGGTWGRGSGIIDSQDQAGGWPELFAAPAPKDTDHDGLPDAWEKEKGLNPLDPADGARVAAGGYTHLEVYLNQIGETPWSVRIGRSFLLRHPDGMTYDAGSPGQKWNYEQGLMLVALRELAEQSGDSSYRSFIRRNLDAYVAPGGVIRTYELTEFNIDNIGPGRALLDLYAETRAEKYRAAADTLRVQLRLQPRTNEGGFWHKKIYPFQMWLDGLFMAEPFYVRYASLTGDTAALTDIANQFAWMAAHARDRESGLLYHAWDESRRQRWADPLTGRSPNFWARAMGWYGMALVDVLDVFPREHPRRGELAALLVDLSSAVLRVRDRESRLWYQVIDQGNRPGNYLEASASSMFTFMFAKGVRLGVLDSTYLQRAGESFGEIVRRLVTVDADGTVNLHQTCRSAGLGGEPYRDGSYDYYISEPKRTNDMKGIGPFLRAAMELERGTLELPGRK